MLHCDLLVFFSVNVIDIMPVLAASSIVWYSDSFHRLLVAPGSKTLLSTLDLFDFVETSAPVAGLLGIGLLRRVVIAGLALGRSVGGGRRLLVDIWGMCATLLLCTRRDVWWRRSILL